MKSDDQIAQVIIMLQQRGFNHDFIIDKEHIRCLQYNELIPPDDFEIVETYYCESKWMIGNGSHLYAIVLTNYNVKGILMSSYQAYVNGMSIRLWTKFNHVFKTKSSAIRMSKGVNKYHYE